MFCEVVNFVLVCCMEWDGRREQRKADVETRTKDVPSSSPLNELSFSSSEIFLNSKYTGR